MRACAFLLTLLIAGPANAQTQLLHQERSLYRNIFVTESGDELCMLFRYPVPLGRESCKLKSDPNKLIFDYTQMMMAGLYLNPKPAKLLIIGEGGGSIPTALQEMYPDTYDTFARLRKELDPKGVFGNTLLRELFPY